MKGCVALTSAFMITLVMSASALANGWVYRGAGWCHYARYGCCCGGRYSIYNYHPAREFVAAYYTNLRGVGKGYSTPAYDGSGYLHRYNK
jgi:hypothetical protein